MSTFQATTTQDLIDRTRANLHVGRHLEDPPTYPSVVDHFTAEEDEHGVTVWYTVVNGFTNERQGAYYRRVGENLYEA